MNRPLEPTVAPSGAPTSTALDNRDTTYDMRQPHRAADLSLIAESEVIRRATGTPFCDPFEGETPAQVRVLKLASDLCCAGEDVPGVGHCHAMDCVPTSNPDITKRGLFAALDVFDAAHRQALARATAREKLFVDLLFAARDLASSRVVTAKHVNACRPEEWICGECCSMLSAGEPHLPKCRAGRVLVLVDQILATANPQFEPSKKEAAPEQGAGCAGDGIRPRVSLLDGIRACHNCGETDSEWHQEHRHEVEVELATLQPNQCVGAPRGYATGHTLYTHRCVTAQKGGAA